jgi:hypothetical protein
MRENSSAWNQFVGRGNKCGPLIQAELIPLRNLRVLCGEISIWIWPQLSF